MGQTTAISFICEFSWYSWVFYIESQDQFSEDTVVLGRYLGPTEPEVGSVLTEKSLKSNGKVVERNTFRNRRKEDYESRDSKQAGSELDETDMNL
jgi:hypothetical protein